MIAVDVIDAAINKVRQHAWPQTMDLEEARAAVAELLEALHGLASFPLEQFDYGNAADDKPIFGANGDWLLTVGMVRRARAAISKATGATP